MGNITDADKVEVLEKILDSFGFKGAKMQFPFVSKNGSRCLATIHAKDIYKSIEFFDWDNMQGLEEPL